MKSQSAQNSGGAKSIGAKTLHLFLSKSRSGTAIHSKPRLIVSLNFDRNDTSENRRSVLPTITDASDFDHTE
jgi:hypothetical protein